jgi:hypothetical protein
MRARIYCTDYCYDSPLINRRLVDSSFLEKLEQLNTQPEPSIPIYFSPRKQPHHGISKPLPSVAHLRNPLGFIHPYRLCPSIHIRLVGLGSKAHGDGKDPSHSRFDGDTEREGFFVASRGILQDLVWLFIIGQRELWVERFGKY